MLPRLLACRSRVYPCSNGSQVTALQAIEQDPQLRLLAQALNSTGLDALVSSPGTNVTIFAPTDAAFAKGASALALSVDGLLGSR